MNPPVPEWLKTDPFVLHQRSQVIFAPQRKIVVEHGDRWLVDANDERYPFSECHQIRLETLNGVYVVVTATGGTLALWREGDRIKLGSGNRYESFLILDPVARAAHSLAATFGGSVVRDPEAALAAIGL